MKHDSIRTERAYVDWIKCFTLLYQKRYTNEMGASEIQTFLTGLAVVKNVAASAQQQALSALFFLYCEVLRQALPWMDDITRAKKPKRLPVVLTQEEVRSVLAHLPGDTWLMASWRRAAADRVSEVAG